MKTLLKQLQVQRFGFLLLPSYSMIAFTSAVETLRMANRELDSTAYEWPVYTIDGQPVAASNGLALNPEGALSENEPLDILFVCGGTRIERAYDKRHLHLLKRLARRRVALGGLCTAGYVLAAAELLDGYRCTVAWENISSMREKFPNIVISNNLYEIDRDRYTCSGGTAALDMTLTMIGERHSQALAAEISEQFTCERIRSRHDRQRIPLRLLLGTSQPTLSEAVALMEANIEEPMSLDELARHVGVSRRQLERLFQKHLHCVPTRYYLELRLSRARQLLLQTSMSIVDIAFACGFVSAPHFSKCYRDFFGAPPREDRRRQVLV